MQNLSNYVLSNKNVLKLIMTFFFIKSSYNLFRIGLIKMKKRFKARKRIKISKFKVVLFLVVCAVSFSFVFNYLYKFR